MAKIVDILANRPSSSFEFFPPRTPAAEAQLEQALLELEPLNPSFVSVTYGAGGSTRERTHDLVVRINRDTSMTAMAHLTCAAHTRVELTEIVTRYRDAAVENILSLGGDPPKELDLPAGELKYATELLALVTGIGDFSVGVAVHPEGHPASTTVRDDRRRQAEKLALAEAFIVETASKFDADPTMKTSGHVYRAVRRGARGAGGQRQDRCDAVPHRPVSGGSGI